MFEFSDIFKKYNIFQNYIKNFKLNIIKYIYNMPFNGEYDIYGKYSIIV